MKTISFDVMGNDKGVEAAVKASLYFVKKNTNYKIILVGDKKEINNFLVQDQQNIEILDAPTVVNSGQKAMAARKGNSSMAQAINLVVNKKADVVLSSGDSGIYLAMTTLNMKRISGFKRPAFMPVFPSIANKNFVMLDCGANLETTPEMLFQWATLASTFVNKVLKVNKPKVGLINIGTEDSKGQVLHQQAHKLLKDNNNINYIGFIESRNLLKAEVDVAVVDGYGGNLILKNMEGSVMALLELLKRKLKSKLLFKIGAFLSKGAYKEVKKTLDYRNAGGAWIIGLNGLAVKTHGGADYKSYVGALSKIKDALESDALTEFKKAVKNG